MQIGADGGGEVAVEIPLAGDKNRRINRRQHRGRRTGRGTTAIADHDVISSSIARMDQWQDQGGTVASREIGPAVAPLVAEGPQAQCADTEGDTVADFRRGAGGRRGNHWSTHIVQTVKAEFIDSKVPTIRAGLRETEAD